jgi:tetratricopeptide (TPR) repeat protein
MYRKCYVLDVRATNPRNLSLSLKNIGTTYFYFQQPDSAFHYIREAARFARQSNDSVYLLNLIHNDLGAYYLKIKEYENALQQLQQVTKPAGYVYLNRGIAFIGLQQIDSARTNLLLSAQSSDRYTRMAADYYLSELEKNRKNYEQAYIYLANYLAQRDSIIDLTRTSDIQILIHQHNEKITEDKIRTEYKITLLVFVIIALAVLLLYSISNRKKTIKQKIQKYKLLQREKEIDILRIQIKKTGDDVLKLQSEKNADLELIQQKEKDLIQLCFQTGARLFMTTSGYQYIQKVQKYSKCLNEKEQEELQKSIHSSFPELIERLHSVCPALTENEILLCCLSILKLPAIISSYCMGNVDTAPIRQKKSRIKTKMTESKCEELFYFLFDKKD